MERVKAANEQLAWTVPVRGTLNGISALAVVWIGRIRPAFAALARTRSRSQATDVASRGGATDSLGTRQMEVQFGWELFGWRFVGGVGVAEDRFVVSAAVEDADDCQFVVEYREGDGCALPVARCA